MFRHFGRLDIAFHDRYTSGRVVSRSTNDVEAIQEMLETGFDSLITAVLTLFGTAVLLIELDWRLGLMCLVAFPILVALAAWFRAESAKTYREVRDSAALVIVQFVETMTGIKAVQAYRREPRNQEIFADVADRYRDINEKTFKLRRDLHARRQAGRQHHHRRRAALRRLSRAARPDDDRHPGGVPALPADVLRADAGDHPVLQHLPVGVLGAGEAGRVCSPSRRPSPIRHVRSHLPNRCAVTCRSTTSRSATCPAARCCPGLNLTVPGGQTVALVGTTGAGKTTIAKLIARFYDPTSGSVTLDGVDLRDLAQSDLRRHVVMVTQENFMFDGTVADNIRFGRPDATDDEVRAAAAAVGADTFIEALPDGYDTDVAKRGGRLSAGQRQLVAFARAFLADPAVLILDEATSSLDIPSERMVQRALETVLADRTALVIAHRLSTVEIADRVLVLEHGRIVEDGPPAELIHGDGHYAALHQAWVRSLA